MCQRQELCYGQGKLAKVLCLNAPAEALQHFTVTAVVLQLQLQSCSQVVFTWWSPGAPTRLACSLRDQWQNWADHQSHV